MKGFLGKLTASLLVFQMMLYAHTKWKVSLGC